MPRLVKECPGGSAGTDHGFFPSNATDPVHSINHSNSIQVLRTFSRAASTTQPGFVRFDYSMITKLLKKLAAMIIG